MSRAMMQQKALLNLVKAQFGRSASVYISGSRAEGLGNAQSDWDYYVVVDAADTVGVGALEQVHAESTLDAEVITLAEVRTRVSTIDDDVSGGRVPVNLVNLDLYYRLLIGSPILLGDIPDIRTELSRETYLQCFRRWSLRRARVLGQQARTMRPHDERVAALLFRDAYVAAVEAWLTNFDEGYPNSKWAFQKVQRASSRYAEAGAAAERIAKLANIGPDLAKYAKEVLAFVETQLGAPLPPQSTTTSAYQLQIDRNDLVPFDGKMCIVTDSAVFELSPYPSRDFAASDSGVTACHHPLAIQALRRVSASLENLGERRDA